MILKYIDKKIRQSFSDSAMHYEALASLQREIGRELIQKIQDIEECDYILDVGMGTGRLTNRMKLFFPETHIIGIDFAPGMIDCACKKYDSFSIIQADANYLPFKEGVFDVVISNLVYQWVNDLTQAFLDAHRILKKDGRLCLTMFGHKTLDELFKTLENTTSVRQIHRRPSNSRVLQSLQEAGFKHINSDNEIIKVHFDDMLALIKWLKDTGANITSNNIYLGKDRLKKANQFYRQNFQDAWGVQASFEVLWIEATK